MKKICICGDEFEAKRATAKYCSEKCKKDAQRGRVRTANLGDSTYIADGKGPVTKITRATTPKKPNVFKKISEGKPSNKIKTSQGDIDVPMNVQMAEARERMNARLRAKGLPLITDKPEVYHFVDTGIPALNEITKELDVEGIGGLPRRKITEIYGPKGSGKSSLIKVIMKANPDLKVLFFDAEGGMVGPPENMDLIKGNIVEDIMPALIAAVESGEYDLVILDSIASLVTRKQFEDDPEGKASMARAFGPEVKRLVAYLHPLVDGLPDETPGTAVLFINQFRSTTQSFGKMEYTVGGKAMEYYASLRLEFRSAKADYIIRDGKLAGQQVRVKVEKTRFGVKDVEFKFPLMFAELQDFNDFYVKRLKEMGLK